MWAGRKEEGRSTATDEGELVFEVLDAVRELLPLCAGGAGDLGCLCSVVDVCVRRKEGS